jgi:hypothetical protein
MKFAGVNLIHCKKLNNNMIKKRMMLISLIYLISTCLAFSQDLPDSIKKEMSLMKNKNNTRYPSMYISLSYIGWNGLPSNVEFQPNNNREVGFYKLFNLKKHSEHFNLALGLSASVFNMHNNVRRWQFDPSGEVTSSEILPDTFDKHKLTAWYMYIPLEMKYKFGKGIKKPFMIGIGGKIGTLIYASTKIEKGDINIQERLRKGISKINYGIYGYFGYKFVGIIAGYNFSPMFDADHSPDVTNWTTGLALMF